MLLLLVTSTMKELNFEFLVCIVSNSTTTLTKVYTRRTFDKIVTPQSCFSDLLPRLNNTITGKGFNLFYEYAVRCIHLSPSWGDSKMYASGSIENLQRTPTEINESVVTVKVKILMKSDTVRIIYNEISTSISLLILCCWYFSCLQMYLAKRFNDCCEGIKIFFQIFLSKVYRSNFWKNTLRSRLDGGS